MNNFFVAALVVIAGIGGAVFLAYNDHPWMALAVLVTVSSIKYPAQS